MAGPPAGFVPVENDPQPTWLAPCLGALRQLGRRPHPRASVCPRPSEEQWCRSPPWRAKLTPKDSARVQCFDSHQTMTGDAQYLYVAKALSKERTVMTNKWSFIASATIILTGFAMADVSAAVHTRAVSPTASIESNPIDLGRMRTAASETTKSTTATTTATKKSIRADQRRRRCPTGQQWSTEQGKCVPTGGSLTPIQIPAPVR